MSETTYYWQGGRRIEIEQVKRVATVQCETTEQAIETAASTGVSIRSPQVVGPGLVKMELPDDTDADITKLRSANVVHHIYHPKGQPDQEILITSSFFIKFRQNSTREAIDQYFRDHHLEVADVYNSHSYLVNVTDETGMNPVRASNLAAENQIVESAEPNLVRNLQRFQLLPSDPLFINQWHLFSPNDDTDLAAGAGINAPGAWEITQGVRDVTVCIADDAIDLLHPDFSGTDKIAGRLNVIAQPDGTSVTFDENVEPRAGDYHGTPCAGVAVAEHNNVGTVGVAPGCSLYAVRFPLSLTEAQLVRMFERISDNADVVSCSWGVGPADAPMSSQFRQSLTSLAQNGGRRASGLVICVAAGNNNCPIKDIANTRTYQFLDQFQIIRSYSGPIDRWIAAHPDVITVSASNSLRQRSAYSSWGQDIAVCAPSNNFDDLNQFHRRGRGIWTTDNEGAGPGTDFTAGSRYTGDFGGTSSATPTVAGVCGLVISANRTLSAAAVREIIEQTASKELLIESESIVNEPGDFDNNGFSLWFGYGKVDAAKAVQRAVELTQAQAIVTTHASDVPLDIPDSFIPVTSTIDVADAGVINELRIALDITHTYIGDLVIDLITPSGQAIRLRNHEGGSQQNLHTVFNPDDHPVLRTLAGTSIQGTWSLRVVDEWNFDQGRLDDWLLTARVTQ